MDYSSLHFKYCECIHNTSNIVCLYSHTSISLSLSICLSLSLSLFLSPSPSASYPPPPPPPPFPYPPLSPLSPSIFSSLNDNIKIVCLYSHTSLSLYLSLSLSLSLFLSPSPSASHYPSLSPSPPSLTPSPLFSSVLGMITLSEMYLLSSSMTHTI